MTRLLLTLVFIALYAGSFPPGGWPWLAWVAPVPYVIALRGARPAVGLALGWLSAFVVAVWITDFLPIAIASYYQQGPVFGALLFTLVVTVMCCPFHMLFSAWYAGLDARGGVARALLVGAAWVAAEYGRNTLGGNPWGVFAYSQAHQPWLIQIADVTGPYGVSFLLLAVGTALADRVSGTVGSWTAVALTGGLVAGTAAYGALRLYAPPPAGATAREVAVVQPNIDLGFQWNPDLQGRNLDEQLRLTAAAWRADKPQLVVWPESAFTFLVEREPMYRAALGAALEPLGLQLVAGGVRAVGERYFNAAFVVEPDGRVSAAYEKQHLVPFAETFPFHSIEWLNRRFGRVQQFSSGTQIAPLPTVVGPAAVAICNEALFPEVVRERVRRGGTFIVNLANDGWLGSEVFSRRVLDVTIFRAVETRRYLVRASTSGTSSIVDPTGRLLAEAPVFAPAYVAAPVRPNDAVSFYLRFGDVFAWGCVAAVAVELMRRRRAGAASSR